jgi:hypothetical protein
LKWVGDYVCSKGIQSEGERTVESGSYGGFGGKRAESHNEFGASRLRKEIGEKIGVELKKQKSSV